MPRILCYVRLQPSVRPKVEILEDRIPAGTIATAQPIAMAAGLDAFGLYSDHSLTAEAELASLHISSHSAALGLHRASEIYSSLGKASSLPHQPVGSSSPERPSAIESPLQLSSKSFDNQSGIWDKLQTSLDSFISDPFDLNADILANRQFGGHASTGSAVNSNLQSPGSAGGSSSQGGFSSGSAGAASTAGQSSPVWNQNQVNALFSGCSVAPSGQALPNNVPLPKAVASTSTPGHGSLG